MTDSSEQQFDLDKLRAEFDAFMREAECLRAENRRLLAPLYARNVGPINLEQVTREESRPETTPRVEDEVPRCVRSEGELFSSSSIISFD